MSLQTIILKLACKCWIKYTDEKLGGSKDAETMVSPVVSRRDIATQMSPDSNTHSSPKDRFSFPPSPLLPTLEQQTHSVKSEVRDVQVDKGVTMIRWSKKHGAKTTMRAPPDVEEMDKNAAEAQASSWDIAEPSKNILKYESFLCIFFSSTTYHTSKTLIFLDKIIAKI